MQTAREAARARWAKWYAKNGRPDARPAVVEKPCPYCGATMRGAKRKQCGSPQCKRRYNADRAREPMRARNARKIANRSARVCPECGEAFPPVGKRRYCSDKCKGRSESAARRAKQRGMKVTAVRRFRIYERDDWICHICGDPVNREAKVPELDAPTLDHVIALAAGGEHSEANLKTAHFYCNSVKRDLPLAEVS